SLPSVSVRSRFNVRKAGLSGRGVAAAVEPGRSTLTSTVANGAATMKMISSTSMTSMNGVTLISCVSSSSSPIVWRTLPAMTALLRGRSGPGGHHAIVEVAADQPLDACRGVGENLPVAGDGAGKDVVDDHGR